MILSTIIQMQQLIRSEGLSENHRRNPKFIPEVLFVPAVLPER
jgi:hypothetical protein